MLKRPNLWFFFPVRWTILDVFIGKCLNLTMTWSLIFNYVYMFPPGIQTKTNQQHKYRDVKQLSDWYKILIYTHLLCIWLKALPDFKNTVIFSCQLKSDKQHDHILPPLATYYLIWLDLAHLAPDLVIRQSVVEYSIPDCFSTNFF